MQIILIIYSSELLQMDRFIVCLICISIGDPIIMKKESWDPINRFSITNLCLSQAITCISMVNFCGICWVQWFEARDGWYWWNCWPEYCLNLLFKMHKMTINLISVNVYCIQNSEGFFNYNLSHGNHSVYRQTTIMT